MFDIKRIGLKNVRYHGEADVEARSQKPERTTKYAT